MFLLLLFSLVGPFLTIDISGRENEKVTLNVPKDLVEVALEYAREKESGNFEVNDKEISPDSLLEALKKATISNKPILEVRNNQDTVIFWIRDEKSIIKNSKKPERLTLDIKDENGSIKIRLPFWLAKMIPSLVIAKGEDEEEVNNAKKLITKVLNKVEELEGGFTLLEVQDENETVKISFE
ncbi:MAG: hypothetical protein U9N06_06840 [candidate division WOR-3 bacterium]|nr:hypothetical protein [candidate division WOR-3 bacterium]